MAAAVIPPSRVDLYDPADREAVRLLAQEEEALLLEGQITESTSVITSHSETDIKFPRSPLQLNSPSLKSDSKN